MKTCPLVVCLLLWLPPLLTAASDLPANWRQAEITALCRFVSEEYAYWEQKRTDWPATCHHLQERARLAGKRADYIRLLTQGLRQLYDEHAHLGSATPDEQRLAPSHTDLRAHWQAGRAMLSAVRGAAAQAGIAPGMEVLAIDGEPVTTASDRFTPRFLRQPDPAARDYGLQQALAGRRDRAQIRLLLRDTDGRHHERSFAPVYPAVQAPLSVSEKQGVAHIRIHNTLGDERLIAAFDQAMARLDGAKALVLDLRDTPSGGNSLVARALLGHFVVGVQPYQRHELLQEARLAGVPRVWVEYVTARLPHFSGPLLVLVGPWTGSMGEGLAIGLHAAADAAVYGSPMAHLLGALGEIRLPNSQLIVRIPVEKLYHVKGLAREAFQPCTLPAATQAGEGQAQSAGEQQDWPLQAAHQLALAAIPTRRACPVIE